MTSKVSVHIHRSGIPVEDFLNATSHNGTSSLIAVKSLDATQPLDSAAAHGIPIRIFRANGIETFTPSDAANRVLDHDLRNVTHVQLVCETSQAGDPQWQIDTMKAMRGRGYTRAFVAGGFPTGNPSEVSFTYHQDGSPHFPMMMTLKPLFDYLDTDTPSDGLKNYMGYDIYFGVPYDHPLWSKWSDWTVFRPTIMNACCQLHGIKHPKVIGLETGFDNVIPDFKQEKGWLVMGYSVDQYMATIKHVDSIDQANPLMVARCYYTLYPFPSVSGWQDFALDSLSTQLSSYINSQKGLPVPAPTPPLPTPSYNKTTLNGIKYIDLRDSITHKANQSTWTTRERTVAIAVHHAASEGTVESDFAYQVNTEGWDHGGYHFGIEADGTLKYVLDLAYQAYHAGLMPFEDVTKFYHQDKTFYNDSMVAVVLQGDLTKHPATAAQSSTLSAFLGAVEGQYGLIPFDFGNGLVPVGTAYGHGELPGKQTSCPGSLKDWLIARRQASLLEYEAYAYYQQFGVKINRNTALWQKALLKRYVIWKQVAATDPEGADLIKPGPAISGEQQTTWGGTQPASFISLTNCRLGVYLGKDNTYHPYTLEFKAA